ncbi:MAG: hypothetical protein KJO08_11065, partial [Gammaproteobacteria bacterium]|nr:hypothetical protein [Gammaproteobacteria bacterium]NNJ84023.1 hypothetical protein [Gammaproteobacteria bacterium]
MDYDLSRHLSTRSFEQLVQALAVAVIGPGVVVFGDGPDGGREATFDGPMEFPNDADPWNGYLVVQAKFRQRPGGDDGNWALDALRGDLEKFADPKRKLRRPEYYLFATNVVLTPVADTGGKDKATQLLNEYIPKLGLKSFHIWDYDQICTLLDTHSDVRTAYSAWITPGDVLTAVLEHMQPQRPDFRQVMSLLMQKDLLADQYVKLGQAGHSDEGRTPLAKVFVDLPVGNAEEFARASAVTDTGQETETPSGISEILHLGARRLDSQSNPAENRPGQRAADADSQTNQTLPGRVVLVGGPGQGKSTLTQFLCQLHRVSLLDTAQNAHLTPESRDACHLIRAQCEAESLELPAMARFPLRVELNAFASALAKGVASSLFDYLLQHIRKRTDHEIVQEDLRAWLGVYPWLIALDGLDEVPASSNRAEVLDAVQDFLVDAHAGNADLLLVATTRPQGYSDDFDSRYYHHRYLLPLPVPNALHYAGRLAEQRWLNDRDKQQRVTGRLERAAKEPATARLMRSPLQVTIMALLVESVGQPPQERWRLFNDYYQVIFRREKERDIPAADLLNSYEADIHAIHQQVGCHLQIHSEQSGGTEAVMGEAEFRELVGKRLTDEGHQGEELARLTQNVIDAALERLVFLVAPREGVIGFEIRSLQEFMAAQWLMNGSDDEIRQRLRAIAPSTHWRNVFLFATGRCFHDKQHLRDSVQALCGEYNEGDGGSHQGVYPDGPVVGASPPVAKDPGWLGSSEASPQYLHGNGTSAINGKTSSRQGSREPVSRDGFNKPSARDGENDFPQSTDLTQTILLGSRLALEILEDGALGNQPKQRQVYARLALRLLELPPCAEHSRLARQYRPELETVFREELQRHLENSLPERRFGAWLTLIELIGREDEAPWMRGLADAYWPEEPESGLGILKA